MFIITQDKVNALLNYLAKKPYAEVFQLIQLLTTLEKAPEVDELKKEVMLEELKADVE